MTAPVVRGSKGPVKLGRLLGKGGEGAVYEVVGESSLVAKVYLRDVPAERAEKLRAMSQLLTPKLAALTAWPRDVLYGNGNKVAGFLMPKISAHDVHEVYGPKSRQHIFPQADWRLLVRTALNTARAFAVVHEAGILVADVNHGGVMVSKDATVRLIDCDSFQLTAGKKTFFCEVGVEDFTPPELQGKAFRGIVRTANHDTFGLAVLIFRLLMLGRHPFAGKHLGKGDLSLGEAIAQCKYAYARDRALTHMAQPPASPPVFAAGQEIAGLWEMAFLSGGVQPNGRPTAERWVFALEKLESNFAKCSSHGGHYFARGSPCPWCAIQLDTGASLFPLPAGSTPSSHAGGPFSLDAVWGQIASVQAPPAVQPATSAGAVAPSPEAQRYASSKSTLNVVGAVAAAVAFVACVANGVFWFLGGLAAWAAWAAVQGMAPSIDKSQYYQRKQLAEDELRSLVDRWNKEASGQPFEVKLAELRRQRDEFARLPVTHQAKHSQLVLDREAAAKARFLDQFEIARATISGIGPAKKSMLESYGVETAADISRNAVLNVPGFGPALTSRLLDWRRKVERGFRFDAASGVDPRDVAELDRCMAERKCELQDALRKGAAELHQISKTILSRRQALDGPIRVAVRAAAQAEADRRAIN